jgi:hypothetical protein
MALTRAVERGACESDGSVGVRRRCVRRRYSRSALRIRQPRDRGVEGRGTGSLRHGSGSGGHHATRGAPHRRTAAAGAFRRHVVAASADSADRCPSTACADGLIRPSWVSSMPVPARAYQPGGSASTPVGHIRHPQGVPQMPLPADPDAVPRMPPVVATRGLVRLGSAARERPPGAFGDHVNPGEAAGLRRLGAPRKARLWHDEAGAR